MALGEAGCVSVHGANRLGSNSLIDLVVFGRAAALRCAELIEPNEKHPELPKDSAELPLARLDRFRHADGGTPTAELRAAHAEGDADQLRRVPHRRGARRGLQAHPRRAGAASDDVKVSDRSLIWNSDLIETLEFDNLIAQAVVTMDSASTAPKAAARMPARTIPSRDDKNWMKHTLAWLDFATRKVTIDYRPVHTYTMTNEVQYIEPKARVY